MDGMTATIWARRTGNNRYLVAGKKYPGVDPTDDLDVAEIGRTIAKENGVPRGSLQMEVRGGPRAVQVVV